MSTLSTRTSLTLMSDSDFIDPTIIDSNSSMLDNITSLTECTSSSRPSEPFDGQWIYETDVQNIRRWSKTDGKWYLKGGSGIACAAGLIAQFSDGTAHQMAGSSSPQIISLHDYNTTLKGGHSYEIVEQGWFSLTASPYQQNNGDFIFPEFFTIWQNGSNPALVDTTSLHLFRDSYQQNVNPNARPYYKKFPFNMGGAIGSTGNIFFRSCMRTAFNPGPFGRPASSNPARAFIYDLGITGTN